MVSEAPLVPPSPNGNHPAHTNGNGKPRLSKAQRQRATRDALILRELAAGKSPKEVAELVGISDRQVRNIRDKADA